MPDVCGSVPNDGGLLDFVEPLQQHIDDARMQPQRRAAAECYAGEVVDKAVSKCSQIVADVRARRKKVREQSHFARTALNASAGAGGNVRLC